MQLVFLYEFRVLQQQMKSSDNTFEAEKEDSGHKLDAQCHFVYEEQKNMWCII